MVIGSGNEDAFAYYSLIRLKKHIKTKTDFDKARLTSQLCNIWSMKRSQINVWFVSFGQSVKFQNWC